MMNRVLGRRLLHTTRCLRNEAPGGRVGTLNLQFSTPTDVLFADVKIARITLPAVSGDMGVIADHVPTIAQLRPGVVEVVVDEKNSEAPQRWFVPGGFAIISADSTCALTAVEAIPLEELDMSRAQEELTKAKAAMESAKGETDKTEQKIGIEVLEAILRTKV